MGEIDKLQKKINSFKEKLEPKPRKVPSNSSLAFNVAIEIVAGTIVGVIIGLFFDNLFDSAPAFLIICLIVSIVAAFRSIWTKYIAAEIDKKQDR